jgi:phage regulator Rha-like protein
MYWQRSIEEKKRRNDKELNRGRAIRGLERGNRGSSTRRNTMQRDKKRRNGCMLFWVSLADQVRNPCESRKGNRFKLRLIKAFGKLLRTTSTRPYQAHGSADLDSRGEHTTRKRQVQ